MIQMIRILDWICMEGALIITNAYEQILEVQD
jgi:hypothetical protein